MRFLHRLLAAAAAAFIFTAFSVPTRADSINLGHVNVSFYEATANVIGLMLERTGLNVGYRSGSHSNIYPLIASGELDLFVAAWLPTAHANYWNEYKNNLVEPFVGTVEVMSTMNDMVILKGRFPGLRVFIKGGELN